MKWHSESGRDGYTTSMSKRTRFGLLEKHYPEQCACSYCGNFTMKHVGRRIPYNKAWNSWWVLYWRRGKVIYYLRYHSIFYRRWRLS